MQHFEINLTNSAEGWHWTLMAEKEGTRVMVAESYDPLPTAAAAAEEAEAEIAEPGRARRLYRETKRAA